MIILDTCAFIWMIDCPEQLSPRAKVSIQKHYGSLAVLPISIWEIAIKVNSGGLVIKSGASPFEWYKDALSEYEIKEISLSARILCASAKLPPIHRDPCDRMIIAGAMEYHCPVVTADKTIPLYPEVNVIW